jgi:hypothetical protein
MGMMEWKWLFVNSCEGSSPVYSADEFLNLCHSGINASMCWEVMLTSYDTWNKFITFNIAVTSHFNFDLGSLTY